MSSIISERKSQNEVSAFSLGTPTRLVRAYPPLSSIVLRLPTKAKLKSTT